MQFFFSKIYHKKIEESFEEMLWKKIVYSTDLTCLLGQATPVNVHSNFINTY